jgi:uncharacterized protein RhaS with RHS repeats
MQVRYYDPATGRFISTDPAPPTVGNPFNFNRFAYTNNNPVANIDPDGKQTTFDAALWLNQADMVKNQSPKGLQQAAEINATQAKAVGAAMMGLALAPTAGFVAASVTSTTVDVLTTGSLVSGIMLNGPSLVASATIVTEGVAAANGVNTPLSPMSLEADGEAILNAAQSANLNRFNDSLPIGNTGTYVDRLGDGVVFTSTVPGKVAGSSAVYQKTVDSAGKTSGFLKTTFAPDGSIVHIKDKIDNTIIKHDR